MKAFLTPLQGFAEFEQIKEKSKTNKGILQVSGCMESQKSHLMYGLSGIAPYRLILAEDERRAREIYEDYSINTPELRLKHFGQKDHVRIYAAEGLENRLKDVGFKTEILQFSKNDYLGLSDNELVIIGWKDEYAKTSKSLEYSI